MRITISAPEYPFVFLASVSKLIDLSNFRFLVFVVKSYLRPFSVGRGTSTIILSRTYAFLESSSQCLI